MEVLQINKISKKVVAGAMASVIFLSASIIPEDVVFAGAATQPVSVSTTVKKTAQQTKITKTISEWQGFSIYWQRKNNVDGYQIAYATNSHFTKNYQTYLSEPYYAGMQIYTRTNLTNYYVRVRTFVKKGRKAQYSAWSPTTKVRTKGLKQITNLKGKANKKSIKLSWKKDNNASGYRIIYADNKKFYRTKCVYVKNSKHNSVTIKNLKKNKKYYIKVLAYKTLKVDGKNKSYWGEYSKPLKISTKK